MPSLKPCLHHGCPNYAEPGSSYCADHGRDYTAQKRSPSNVTIHKHPREWHRYRQRIASAIRQGKHVFCGICGERITNPDGNAPDGLAIDHVVSIAEGGAHEQANWQPSHRACNRRKGGAARATPRVPHPAMSKRKRAR